MAARRLLDFICRNRQLIPAGTGWLERVAAVPQRWMQMEALTGHYLMNGNGPLEVIKSPVAHKHSLARSLPVRLRQLQRCIPNVRSGTGWAAPVCGGPTALFNLWGTSGPHGCVCGEGWPSWSSGNKLRRDGWLRWLWACWEGDDRTEVCEKAAKIPCSSNSNIPVTSGYHFLSTGLPRPAWSPFFFSQIKDTFLIILCQQFSPPPPFFSFLN